MGYTDAGKWVAIAIGIYVIFAAIIFRPRHIFNYGYMPGSTEDIVLWLVLAAILTAYILYAVLKNARKKEKG